MQVSNAHYEPLARRKIELSKHASRRGQQRAIPEVSVPLILAYGERSHDGHGGVRYLMTGRSLAQVAKVVGNSKHIDALAGCYAVVSADEENTVITLGHRYS